MNTDDVAVSEQGSDVLACQLARVRELAGMARVRINLEQLVSREQADRVIAGLELFIRRMQ